MGQAKNIAIRNRGINFILILAIFSTSISAFGSIYYISKSTGSDTNTATQAQSKSTPWAHLPGMVSCAGNCASYTPVAGDEFILKGCDVWVSTDLPVTWNWSGNSGSPIYIGVDKTWYNTSACSSGWNRPIWNAGKNVISGVQGNYFFYPSPSGSTNYVTLDDIEMKQLEITSSSSGGYISWIGGTSQGWTFSNNYLHAWDASADNCVLIQGTYAGTTSSNDVYSNNVIDGSDATGPGMGNGVGTCYAFYTSYTGVKIIDNVISNVVNPIVVYSGSNGLEVGGNLIENGLSSLGGENHCNLMEIVGGGTFWIHDNVFMNMECSGGESLMLGNSGETSYVWNNVMYNIGNGQPPSFPQTSGQTGINGLYFWNNTIVTGNGLSCFSYSGQSGGSITNLYMQNNHCITTASAVWSGGISPTNLVNINNLLMTPTIATNDGYTASETYAFSPTSSSSPTVGSGSNLTSSWPNGFSTNDTAYGADEETVNGVLQAVSPARTQNARPASGAWDVGAYEFAAVDPPAPPSNLTAMPQ